MNGSQNPLPRGTKEQISFYSLIKREATKIGKANNNFYAKRIKEHREIVSMCTFRRMMYPT
jgi:hypothetical protein